MASENKDEMAKHSSWSEGILGDKAAPSAVAYSWIDRNVPVSGRTHMLLADLTAGVHARNPSLSVQQAVLAAAKDMVQKGVATSDLRTFVEQGGRFSRPGAPDTFAVEDRFYFGKGRKERFAEQREIEAKIRAWIDSRGLPIGLQETNALSYIAAQHMLRGGVSIEQAVKSAARRHAQIGLASAGFRTWLERNA